MRRRALLLGSIAPVAFAAGADAAPAARKAAGRRPSALPARRLQIRHAHTGARFSGPYHNGRTHDLIAMADLSLVLADSRTGAVRPFDPLAIDVLWEVAQKAGATGEFLIFSGYRTPETNALVDGAGDSQHLRAAALDVHMPADRLPGFGETALRLGLGGVGIYTSRGFVHLDSGPVRRWGDVPSAETVPSAVSARSGARPARPDPLARMAEAWAATRGR
jgi:uncharacterized protein YcbK (DUF882 family)